MLTRIYREIKKTVRKVFKFLGDNTKYITLSIILDNIVLVLFILFKKVRINVFNVEMSEELKNKALKVVNKVKD